jgi:hypothetical protein
MVENVATFKRLGGRPARELRARVQGRMPPRLSHLAAAVVVLAAAAAGAAGLSWPERAAGAPLQVVARCQSRSSQWEGGSIYSYSQMSVLRTITGTPDPSLVVRQRGGEVDGVGQSVSHVALLEPGSTYLLFLRRDGVAWSPTAGGVNPVALASDGEQTVGDEPLEEVLAELGAAD